MFTFDLSPNTNSVHCVYFMQTCQKIVKEEVLNTLVVSAECADYTSFAGPTNRRQSSQWILISFHLWEVLKTNVQQLEENLRNATDKSIWEVALENIPLAMSQWNRGLRDGGFINCILQTHVGIIAWDHLTLCKHFICCIVWCHLKNNVGSQPPSPHQFSALSRPLWLDTLILSAVDAHLQAQSVCLPSKPVRKKGGIFSCHFPLGVLSKLQLECSEKSKWWFSFSTFFSEEVHRCKMPPNCQHKQMNTWQQVLKFINWRWRENCFILKFITS